MLFKETGLTRYGNNPIFSPANVPNSKAVFNCGQTMYKGKTILLVPIVPEMPDGTQMHVAESFDGIHFTMRDKPLIEKSRHPIFSKVDGNIIDPRVTYFEEDKCFYIMRPCNSAWGCCEILGKTTDFETYEDIEIVSLPHNRGASLFPEKINGKYARLDRPYSLIGDPHNSHQFGNIWISFSPDLIYWGEHRPLL
jgi:beta-1,4-mannooligosaccharide/beta-1,4-mannosyl-N-acetylglucosamine phosphorylase